ncbi:MAG: hypothetical protein SFV23_16020, partial [Planctomycetaceae bacterium]|nr:hypothetical protein [Planctomycetaceae bacterium]
RDGRQETIDLAFQVAEGIPRLSPAKDRHSTPRQFVPLRVWEKSPLGRRIALSLGAANSIPNQPPWPQRRAIAVIHWLQRG